MKYFVHYRKSFLTAILFWTFVIVGLFVLDNYNSYQSLELTVQQVAREGYKKDVIYRKWSASKGGVYASVEKNTPPNPHLSHIPERDIVTPSGKKLTLVNPAYMTRQVYEITDSIFATKGHITSLNPIRKLNAPDKWEKEALLTFEDGNLEYFEIDTLEGLLYYRFMGAFIVDESCMKCHAQQGYKIGDVRGGISIVISWQPYLNIYQSELKSHYLLYGTLWLVGVLGLVFVMYKTNESWSKRIIIEDALRDNEEKFHSVFNNVEEAIAQNEFVFNENGEIIDYKILEVNPAFELDTGLKRDEVIGKNATELYGMSSEYIKIFWRDNIANTGTIKTDLFVEHSGKWKHIITSKPKNNKFITSFFDITEHKKTESELRESQELFSLLMKYTPIYTFIKEVTENSSKVIQASENFIEMIGITNDEMCGKDMFQLFPEELAEKITKDDWEVVSKKDVIPFEETLNSKHYTTIKFPIYQKDRILLAGYTIDMTERIKAEEKLRESEERNRAFLNANPDMTFVFDKNGVFLDFSSGGYAPLMSPELFVGKNIFKVLPLDIAELTNNKLQEVFQTGQIQIYDYELDIDNNIRYYESRLVLCGENKAISIVRDISERKKAEIALRESEEKYRLAMESTNDGMWDWDIANNTVYYSPSWERILELKSIPKVFEDWSSRIHPDDISLVTNTLKVHLDNNSVRWEQEHRLRTESGDWKWVLGRGTVTSRDKDEKPLRMVGTMIDLTERKRNEEELRKLTKLESLGILAGGIAHNFKNILANISFNISLAKYKPEKTMEYLEKMDSAVVQASALATRFQTFSSGGEPVVEAISLSEVINEAVNIGLSGSEITYETNICDGNWTIEGDAKQLNEVFMNLILNSKQAMPKGGRIEIMLNNIKLEASNKFGLSEGEYINIYVKDSGYGIPKDIMKKIFDPFYTTKTNGTGLGLSSAHYIINKHKGIIMVDSELDRWTRFDIYLPATDKAIENLESNKEKIVKGGGMKILFMDDNEMLRENIADFGDILDYNIETAENGEIAVEMFKTALNSEAPYSAVILDLTLQGCQMQGEDVLKEMLKIDPEVKAIVFSGHSTKPIVANYQNYGFKGRLDKPITIEKLSEVLKEIAG